MKSFIVIGIGRFGGNLARTLAELGYEVLALDESEERISKIADHVTHAVVGDAKDEEVLHSVGARNFDCAVISLSDDIQASVLVTMLLKELGVSYVVAKATSDVHMRLLEKVGADKVVFPEKDMGARLARALVGSNLLEYMEMSDNYVIAEINVPARWVGKSLKMLNLRASTGINAIALKKPNKEIKVNINPDYLFTKEDIIVVLGTGDDMEKLTKYRT